MNDQPDELDRYDAYEAQFDPTLTDRRLRRRSRPGARRKTKTQAELVDDVAEAIGLEGGFETSYTPAKHERQWLHQSLQEFFQQELISDVEALIKGGKEANVYRCAAHPATGETWLAAKIYRPRMFRNLRNDHRYRQGRNTLLPNGRPMKAQDARLKKALQGRTAYGKQLAHVSWLMHEYNALALLHESGAHVPRPFAARENAILMSYVGDGHRPAPALNEISLERDEAERLFIDVLANVELMLEYGRVHGDLSAYNILYWQGDVTLIDFPQVVNSVADARTRQAFGNAANPDAYDILGRDIARVCDYFQRQGVDCDAETLLDDLWARHISDDSQQRLADASRWQDE